MKATHAVCIYISYKHSGNPSALAMNANDSVQETLNPLFSSVIFLFFPLGSMAHHTPAGLFTTDNSQLPGIPPCWCVAGYDANLRWQCWNLIFILHIVTALEIKNVCVMFVRPTETILLLFFFPHFQTFLKKRQGATRAALKSRMRLRSRRLLTPELNQPPSLNLTKCMPLYSPFAPLIG